MLIVNNIFIFHGKLANSSPKHLPEFRTTRKHKPGVERPQTLGHPKSINPDMINHVTKQSSLIF